MISILTCLLATGWSGLLMRRAKDRRMGFLPAMLTTIAIWQLLLLIRERKSWAIHLMGWSPDLLGLLVSILALLGIFFFERIVIEKQKKIEALREKEFVFDSLLIHSPFSVWMCNGEGTIIFANQAALGLFGVREPSQIISRYNIYTHTTEAEKRLLPYFERAWAGEVVRFREELHMGSVKYDTSCDGTVCFYTTLFPVPSPDSPRPSLVAVQEDITEKVQTEKHVQHLNQILKAIRNVNQLIVREKDQEKLLQGMCDILNQARGYRFIWIGLVEERRKDVFPVAKAGIADEYLKSVRITWDDSETGKGPTGSAIKTKAPCVMRDIARDPLFRPWREEAMKRGYASSAAIPLVYKERVFGALNVYATSPDSFDEEEIDLLVEVGRDIAYALRAIELEQKRIHAEQALLKAHKELELKVAKRTEQLARANIQLQEMDRLKSEFLATMSHELRTPLNSIIGFTGILLKGIPGELNDEQDRQLTMVYSSAKHLLSLINGILDLSKIESGKMEISADRFRMEDLVSEVTLSLSPMLSQKGLRLTTEIQNQIGDIYSDKKKVFQVLLNLVNNAVKFTERGEVKIECRRHGHNLEVSVSDTGIGIKRENMELLFDAFRQIDGTAQRRYQGSGLGLYLCKKLVTLLGGKIWAESQYGEGSKFAFTLPIMTREDD